MIPARGGGGGDSCCWGTCDVQGDARSSDRRAIAVRPAMKYNSLELARGADLHSRRMATNLPHMSTPDRTRLIPLLWDHFETIAPALEDLRSNFGLRSASVCAI